MRALTSSLSFPRSGTPFAEYTDIGDNFNAEVGFVLRTGITDLYVASDQADERGRPEVRNRQLAVKMTYVLSRRPNLDDRQFGRD